MCGIIGLYRLNNFQVDESLIVAQCQSILHRGPDDQGVFIDRNFGFGMRRLSIIDIEGGHQPIESIDGRFVIIFNGEIYNHLELRRQLEALGHQFRSHSDTETILVAWQQWRHDAWAKLEGMFAIAIWDRHERMLVLARDPVGIKPLYITQQPGGFAFASEIKSFKILGTLPGFSFDVDPRSVHDYLSFGHVRTPRSIYRQIRTLPPGHTLTLSPDNQPQQSAYWIPRYTAGPKLSQADWVEEFRHRWLASVERHMLADVDVGAFLSGGVDSSAVVAAMSRFTERPIRVFTIGFLDPRFDETPYASAIARHFGCEHISRVMDLRSAMEVLPAIQQCYDEPFADPAAVPTWYLSKLSAEHVKVVLSGEGGDELFAGYKSALNEQRMTRYAGLKGLLGPAAKLIDALPSTPWRKINYRRQSLLRFLNTAMLPDGFSRFFAKLQITSPALREAIYQTDFHNAYDGPGASEALRDEYFPEPGTISDNGLEQILFAELTLNLPSAMLTKVDRATMAHSLEARVPFLSHKFVEWALTVPLDMKMRQGTGKYIVRKAIEPWLPSGHLDRKKQGFKLPLADWFAGDFGEYARSLWYDSGASDSGFFSPPAVDTLFREHKTRIRNHSRFLYALSIFSLWWARRL